MICEHKKSKSFSFFKIIKKIFFIVLFLQIVPIFFKNFKNTCSDYATPKTLVGHLNIKNEITDPTFYIKRINEFAKNTEIKALLVSIDSPGGYAGSSQIIYNELKRFKKNKPVVALIENIGASGGYYIASAATTIIASPLSLVGSIGALFKIPNVKEFLASWKIQFYHIQSGHYKTAGSPFKEMTAEELQYLQNLSDEHYKQFIKDVSESRNLDINEHTIWGNGKAFTGNQALELKLIDKLGSYNDALDELKIILKSEEEIKLVKTKKDNGIMSCLINNNKLNTDDFMDKFVNKLSTALTKNLIQQPVQI